MSENSSEDLISSLFSDPVGFAERGDSNKLLVCINRGASMEPLRALLQNENRIIQREAVWIVSELGNQGSSLIYDIIPFINDEERVIRYEAIESVMLFSEVENHHEFRHIVHAFETEDDVIRALAMRLATRASRAQLTSTLEFAQMENPDSPHCDGLRFLLHASCEAEEVILAMMNSSNILLRRYGAVVAKRCKKTFLKGDQADQEITSFFKRPFFDT